MVEINFKQDKFGFYEFKAREHAGDSIVCSACSALGMALVSTVMSLEGARVSANYKKGYIDLEIIPTQHKRRQADIDMAFTTVYIGLKQVEATHPTKVKVTLEP